ncbi:phosphinothricin acetyltransferase [Bifidobacterium bohemicum]|uniref:GCN5-like N-acetyltransferase n=1 Tax=Bifidobacterium bohemicum DSM 22767 TaxID=1437606 RepID=A0A086ZJZ7_9BIFI|nr:GNAT family N-acetyltransferase [Bifidobacterium bohemicum]KFI46847.1 GCN5-like N-acetyltransferase [Bifidobacterium bohemicum DSM 22767]SCB82942.1 phosphinothricin acetyltransferase [Bifidobacterium bohemicum]
MTTANRIRDAREGDLQAITDIYNEAVIAGGSSADLTPRTLDQRRVWVESHCPRDLYPVVVVEDESGKVVGFGSLSRFHPRAGYDGVVELSYYVASSAQGQGYGTSLVDWLVGAARARGHRVATALIFATNTPSVSLVRAHNFQRFGLLPHAVRTATVSGYLDMSYWYLEL